LGTGKLDLKRVKDVALESFGDSSNSRGPTARAGSDVP
jgi:hypothetical protein